MKFLKLCLCTLTGAICGAVIMYLILPAVCGYFVGPIYGDDQMSQNFTIFLVGTPLLALVGAITGWLLGSKIIKKQ
ncbi:hypothetical protein [Pseudescherichia sp.]|uniref:hypothetical protein n=1 Tax=Pseudescherichia sp. TaxID=2055881 RepID=UPI00289CDE95|nr:hypothetical protein [Pseudescherichia sp.]